MSSYTPLISRSDYEHHLTPSNTPSALLQRFPTTYRLTISTELVPRVLSALFSLIAFIIFVRDGDGSLIAADIFLMLNLLCNVALTLHYFFSHLLKVTVQLREHAWEGAPTGLQTATVLEGGLGACLLVCLIIGHIFGGRYHDNGFGIGVAMSYLVVVLQLLSGVPKLAHVNLTFSLKISDLTGKVPLDAKRSDAVDADEQPILTPRSEGTNLTAEDLV